ncbi:MAG: TIGR03118 family protein [Phycisphaerales bacterium]|nr:TIGR03118 family protein [Phycisphaerales bacterium]
MTPRLRTLPLLTLLAIAGPAQAQFLRHDLVSDQPGMADFTDPALVNPWGIAFNPTGFVWVADNHTGKSTLYNGLGQPQSLIVDVPSLGASTGGPVTGIAFYGGAGFQIGAPGASAAARFIFAGEDGIISAWAPSIPPPPPSTQAQRVVDHSASGANYKGLSVGSERLFAADFANGRIDAFDNTFAPLSLSFTDPTLPAGMSPFNVKAIGDKVYVAYAKIDPATGDEITGAGLGALDVFNAEGVLERRLVNTGAELNAPWGMTIAPAGFGDLAGALLVGNFGDGRINAFDPATGAFLSALTDASGAPIEIDGLWGIEFGNGVQQQPVNTLFFAAGPDDETHGVYGRIDAIPAPGPAALALAALPFMSRRRR